uniref:Uncharacterized protein n=1 Tax=Vitrella brassicaformis TaxID=1169539 RepID=A0A7S1JNR0_9ALVE|mmetsp:Transcript_16718/g.40118  ORF Transcript_16718/g.40118 Transcript_16718/m.40118 type:complete len:420 (+) Transcript_16718:644-1903(+)
MMTRLKKEVVLFLPPMALSLFISIDHQLDPDGHERRQIIASIMWSSTYVAACVYFLRTAGSLGMRAKREYTIKATAAFAVAYTMGLVWIYALSPKYAAAASTDGDRLRMAVIYQAVLLPPIGLVNKLVRSLKEGPPTCNSLHITMPAMVYILFPRMLQSEAVKFSSKLVHSVFMSLFDLITDISAPYWVLLYVWAERLVKARSKKRTPTGHHLTNIARATTEEEAISGPPIGKENDAMDAVERQESQRNDSHLLRRQSSIMSTALSLSGAQPGCGPTGGLQSALTLLELSPRYLRGLADQTHIWSNCELTALLFTNLSVLTVQACAGAPWKQLVEEGIGLVLLVAIEQLFELCVLCILMRWNNLPMLSSRSEKGVLRRIMLILFLVAGTCISGWLPFFLMSLVRAVGRTVAQPGVSYLS